MNSELIVGQSIYVVISSQKGSSIAPAKIIEIIRRETELSSTIDYVISIAENRNGHNVFNEMRINAEELCSGNIKYYVAVEQLREALLKEAADRIDNTIELTLKLASTAFNRNDS
jgi:hypothetical protein